MTALVSRHLILFAHVANCRELWTVGAGVGQLARALPIVELGRLVLAHWQLTPMPLRTGPRSDDRKIEDRFPVHQYVLYTWATCMIVHRARLGLVAPLQSPHS